MPYTGIFIAADPIKDLLSLKEEMESIETSFDILRSNSIINMVINTNADDKTIGRYFLGDPDIRVFHYSGHAGNGMLMLQKGQFQRINILAGMARRSKHLNLIFLNGCSTAAEVDKFFEYGANLVIATSAPVYDKVACNFSKAFYRNMAREGMSIGDAFTAARTEIKNEIEARIAEISKESEKQWKDYAMALKEFAETDTARKIWKGKEEEEKGVFHWAIYHNSNCAREEREKREAWKLKRDFIEKATEEHEEPCFDFLKSLGENAGKLNDDLHKNRKPGAPEDPRCSKFSKISDLLPNAYIWRDDATTDLILKIKGTLLLPLIKPFDALINYCNDGRPNSKYDEPEVCKELLMRQLDLYKALIKTATIIMLSDLMESVVKVSYSSKGNIKRAFKDNFNDTLRDLLRDLTEGKKHLNDIPYCINLVREVSLFLLNARNSLQDTEDKEVFEQFIEEYNGNTQGTPEQQSIVDEIQQELIFLSDLLDEVKKGHIDELPARDLRKYCSRAESALIEIFEQHKYLSLYEILTVGKVEAYRQRDTSNKTINHEVVVSSGIIPPVVVEFSTEFTENYSVVLVCHRNKLTKYLSLSPFIINIGPFYDADNPLLLFYFHGREASKIRYCSDNKSDTQPSLDMDIHSNRIDNSIFTLAPEILREIPRNTILARRAPLKFNRVKEQYTALETKLTELVQ